MLHIAVHIAVQLQSSKSIPAEFMRKTVPLEKVIEKKSA